MIDGIMKNMAEIPDQKMKAILMFPVGDPVHG
jgi:hypothetical protein